MQVQQKHQKSTSELDKTIYNGRGHLTVCYAYFHLLHQKVKMQKNKIKKIYVYITKKLLFLIEVEKMLYYEKENATRCTENRFCE